MLSKLLRRVTRNHEHNSPARSSSDAQHGGNSSLPMPACLTRDAAAIVKVHLEQELSSLASAWFPRCVDSQYGGFLCEFDYRWRPAAVQPKMLEYQARCAFTLARLAAYSGFESYRLLAEHGFDYLAQVMWDKQYGGFYRMLDRSGCSLESATKHGHGTAYAISALSAYYCLAGSEAARELALKSVEWLDRSGYDVLNGGYFGPYRRDGERITSSKDYAGTHSDRDCIGTPFGYKDSNTNADMLAALADLSSISNRVLVRERLEELFYIVRDKVVVPPGAVHMCFTADWTPIPEMNRYAYSIHTANILARAGDRLGLLSDQSTLQTIKSLVDTVLRYGWDQPQGGFAYGGSTFGPLFAEDLRIFFDKRYWWPQAEGTRALLRLAILFPEERSFYYGRFTQLWDFIQSDIADKTNGGWIWFAARDQEARRKQPKASAWKDPSHEILSILECLELVKHYADGD